MENPNPGELFYSTFTDEVNDTLVAALRAAYRTACEHHVPDQGSDDQAFGFNLYKFAVHEECKAASTVECMKVLSRNPTFRLRVGEYELACHRVGSSERQDIWKSFPSNDGAVCTMVEEQLWLPGLEQTVSILKARKLVLAHFGGPEDGFRAAYLCVPGRTEKGRIAAWNFATRLWVAEEEQLTALPGLVLPPEETVDAPVVRRKAKQSTGDQSAADALPAKGQPEMAAAPAKAEPEEDVAAEVSRKEAPHDENKVGDDENG